MSSYSHCPIYTITGIYDHENSKLVFDGMVFDCRQPVHLQQGFERYNFLDTHPDYVDYYGMEQPDIKIHLPAHLQTHSDLTVNYFGNSIVGMPKRLFVGGNLTVHLSYVWYQEDTEYEILEVAQDCHISYSKSLCLPETVRIGGDLDISLTQIHHLPKELSVGGNLLINYNQSLFLLQEEFGLLNKVQGQIEIV